MREIKFRIWDEQRNKFHYWGFIDNCFVGIGTAFGINYTEKNSEQYTGLKDRNGVGIYEGDVVNVYDWGSPYGLIGEGIIEFNNEGSIQTDNMLVEDQYDFYCKAGLQIIGNIHEDNKTNDN